MKNKILISLLLIVLIGCNNSERSVGFTNWSDDGTKLKFHLGTENSISVVKKFDKLIQDKNYDQMKELFSDTAKFTYHNGVENSLKEFIDLNIKRDSSLIANNERLLWEPQNAFSVDLDPKTGGEHVNMLYLATYENSESKSKFYANLWFYVINGKIVRVNQYNQTVKD